MKKYLIISLAIMMVACHPNRIYEDHIDPSGNNEWNRDEVLKFDISINDTSIKYDLILALRFATGYPYSWCTVSVTEISPGGAKTVYEHKFQTMNDEGYMGEAAGDIYDLEEMFQKDRRFSESGTYHYELSHKMPDDKIHMVMEVGIIVEKEEPSATQ